MDDSNFLQLDAVLSRVRRRTIQEVTASKAPSPDAPAETAVSKTDEDDLMLTQLKDEEVSEDVHWDEWVDAAKCSSEV